MERNTRFLAVGLCALLSVLFVFSANMLADQETIAGEGNVGYKVITDSGWGDSDESINQDEDDQGEEAGEGFQGVPSDSDEESLTDSDEGSLTEGPSDETDLPTAYQGGNE